MLSEQHIIIYYKVSFSLLHMKHGKCFWIWISSCIGSIIIINHIWRVRFTRECIFILWDVLIFGGVLGAYWSFVGFGLL